MRKSEFTLLEVIIALSVLGMGLAVAFGVSASGRLRTMRSYRDMLEEHMLIQAAEYYMLDCRTDKLPEEVFPYRDYSASVSFSRPENLPDGISDELRPFKLAVMRVTLVNQEEKPCGELTVERIVPDDL